MSFLLSIVASLQMHCAFNSTDTRTEQRFHVICPGNSQKISPAIILFVHFTAFFLYLCAIKGKKHQQFDTCPKSPKKKRRKIDNKKGLHIFVRQIIRSRGCDIIFFPV